MRRGLFILSVCFVPFVFVLPDIVFAQVVINEVMYNPQGTDTGREWLELYNEGQTDVTMVGGSGKGSWRINDGSNHTLTDPASGTGRGSLTIPAGSYLIIASDPTDFISGEYAGGSYSVVKSSISLNNNGATLTLLDGTGSTVDTVTYSPSQGGNDDGSSLQHQSDGSWLAALPTPGAANSNIQYIAPVENDASDQSETNAQTASSTDQATGQPQTPELAGSYVGPPAPSLYADAGADRTVIVDADVEFDASAYDKTQTLLDPTSVRFLWNFGDGSTAEGDAVLHHFSYPGKYAVVLDIADNKNAAQAQITVTAQPAALSFSLLQDGGAGIQNLAGYDLDLSGWIVKENSGPFSAQFVLPQDSKVLSGSSIQLSPQTLGFRASSSTVLGYPNGAPALTMGENSATTTSQNVQAEQAAPVSASDETGAAPAPSSPSVVDDPVAPTVADNSDTEPGDDISDETIASDTIATTTILQTASAASAPLSNYLWWFGVAALAAAVLAAIIAAGFFKRGEWDVVEEKQN